MPTTDKPEWREYEVEFGVTLLVTDRGLKPSADQLRHHLIELGATFAHEDVDVLDVTVDELFDESESQ